MAKIVDPKGIRIPSKATILLVQGKNNQVYALFCDNQSGCVIQGIQAVRLNVIAALIAANFLGAGIVDLEADNLFLVYLPPEKNFERPPLPPVYTNLKFLLVAEVLGPEFGDEVFINSLPIIKEFLGIQNDQTTQ